jgi:hypothetical protein
LPASHANNTPTPGPLVKTFDVPIGNFVMSIEGPTHLLVITVDAAIDVAVESALEELDS